MKALIDGDVVTYQAGFASDIRKYHVNGYEFDYKKEALEHCKNTHSDPRYITKTVTPEPIEHCLHSVKLMIENMCEQIDADQYVTYLTTTDPTFRHKMYTQYKANRSGEKPLHYAEIRSYLQDHHNAVVTLGNEADDWMGLEQMDDLRNNDFDPLKAETCICTVDKDLNMIPGWHFNWRKEEMYWISQHDADFFFWEQFLTGDTADNIPGIKGVGEKTAKKILASCSTNQEAYDTVFGRWMDTKTATADAIHQVGDLLWIQRHGASKWHNDLGIQKFTS